MRRLVVYVMVGSLAAASLAPATLRAQEPSPFENPVPVQNRDLTPYVVGLGAIMGVIAFNIAAPTVASWFSAAGRSLANIGAVTTAARQQIMTGAVRAAPAAAEAAATARTATAVVAEPAASAAASSTASSSAPIVPPLTQSMLAQAQIAAAAAAGAGAVVAGAIYRLFNGAH